MNADDLRNKISALDIDKVAAASIEETADVISDLNAEQLHRGLTAFDGNFPTYRNDEYARMKNKMNPLPGYGNPDIFLTGAFVRDIETKVVGDDVEITSTNSKTEMLVKKYGDKYLFGLSEKFHQEYVNETLQPVWIKKIKEATGL